MHLQAPAWIFNLQVPENKLLLLVGMIVSIIILSFLINSLLMASIGGIYRIFVAPGVIVHELSHALGCIITGAKITSIQVFKKDGGEVRHTAPKIPIIGQIIISLAPFVIGFLAVFFIAKAVGIKTIAFGGDISFLSHPFQVLWEMLKSIDFGSIRTWLAFYLVLAIAVTMTPSSQDLRNIFLSMVSIAIIIYVLVHYLKLHISYDIFLRPELLAILGSAMIVLLLALLLSIIIAVISGLFRAL